MTTSNKRSLRGRLEATRKYYARQRSLHIKNQMARGIYPKNINTDIYDEVIHVLNRLLGYKLIHTRSKLTSLPDFLRDDENSS